MSDETNDRHDQEPGGANAGTESNTITPLPGEPGIPDIAARQRTAMSKKGLLAATVFIGSVVAVSAFTIQRFAASGKKGDEADTKLVRDKPSAATAEPRKLDMPTTPVARAVTAGMAASAPPRIPARASCWYAASRTPSCPGPTTPCR